MHNQQDDEKAQRPEERKGDPGFGGHVRDWLLIGRAMVTLPIQVEREEEHLTNNLQRRLGEVCNSSLCVLSVLRRPTALLRRADHERESSG